MISLNILKLDAGHAFNKDTRSMTPINFAHPNITNIDQYKFHEINLDEFNVLAITDFIDQEYLYEYKHKIEQFLEAGKIVVACTHIFRPWLPGTNLFMPKTITKHTDYEVKIVSSNCFFNGVDTKELTYRKGVSGFFARGYHPVQKNHNVEVLLTFNDGTPITYIDRTSTNGTIITHSARDLLSYSTGDNTTKRISTQFMSWLEEELERLNKRY